ncbi:MAG: hypothetical protein JO211_07350 [Acidobacteriaceae bacterium]|nr:hypothetical protein [Acidobacteriaceae bacterium]
MTGILGHDRRKANALERAWQESERRYRERLHKQQVAQAFAAHCSLRDAHQVLAEEHARAAELLCEEDGVV